MVSARSIESGKVEAKTLKEQVFAALDNVRGAMEEAKSSMNNIIKDTVFGQEKRGSGAGPRCDVRLLSKICPRAGRGTSGYQLGSHSSR